MNVHPDAGQAPTHLADLEKLEAAYYAGHPDPGEPTQRVTFGTSGHRGSSLNTTFNEDHILATTQAICDYRRAQGTNGPLYLGIDTHALSVPAFRTALEVLAANGVDAMISSGTDYTPTPAVSHAILTYNDGRASGLADGIVITPSHNPPEDGGFKYNPPSGGPAPGEATAAIEKQANEYLRAKLAGVQRMAFSAAVAAPTTHRHDFRSAYVADLGAVIDFEAMRAAGVRMAVDPLGGAGVHYWGMIAEFYGIDLTVVNDTVDKTFRFMTLDWDGKIRMDPSSAYTMRKLVALKDRYDVAFACDTDHDRHGIVTRTGGLMAPNHYLATCIHYLFPHRPKWSAETGVGKTLVSSSMIDRVAAELGRRLYEVPVGFKWFVDGLVNGSLGFVGEESAGASFLRRNGKVWTTDKDGLIAGLLAGEMTARTGEDPALLYNRLTERLGNPQYARMDAPATAPQKAILSKMTAADVKVDELAGEKLLAILTEAPGNGARIGGLKLETAGGWCAARPSGTEDVYKIYAESFHGADHLAQIQKDAQAILAQVFAARG